MSILDLDLGNQRLKWRLGGAGAQSQHCPASDLRDDLRRELAGARVERIRVSSVGRHEALLLETLAALYPAVAPEMARVVPECAGVRCGYDNPAKLGVDRWLALLAVRQERACVVDLGTAVTLDYLERGVHLGGFIVPGLQVMRQSLVQDTRDIDLPEFAPPGDVHLPGRNTADGLNRGIGLSLVALVEYACRGAEGEQDWPLVLTGGDAPWLATQLRVEYRVETDLVLDGLALALP